MADQTRTDECAKISECQCRACRRLPTYDELAARLRSLEQERDDLQQKCTEAFDDAVLNMVSKTRYEALEQACTALREYAVHKDGCAAWPSFPGHFTGASKVGSCDCGLSQLLDQVSEKTDG